MLTTRRQPAARRSSFASAINIASEYSEIRSLISYPASLSWLSRRAAGMLMRTIGRSDRGIADTIVCRRGDMLGSSRSISQRAASTARSTMRNPAHYMLCAGGSLRVGPFLPLRHDAVTGPFSITRLRRAHSPVANTFFFQFNHPRASCDF